MSNIIDEIREEFFKYQDVEYRNFQAGLVPTADVSASIGVRTPGLRRMAKEFMKREDIGVFLDSLPHEYFEENQLQAFIISEMKDYEACMERLTAFLPYVDNWATCDQMSPKIFKKHRAELLEEIKIWIKSEHTYTVRFAICMLMEHFLNEDFDISYPEMVSKVRSEEYYINMMTSWYYATAHAKQYDAVLHFIEEKKLDVWTHNKAIQKSIESRRITPEQKEYLRGLKIKASWKND